jgi:hypothetical protein
MDVIRTYICEQYQAAEEKELQRYTRNNSEKHSPRKQFLAVL